MLDSLSFNQFETIAKKHRNIAVYQEMPADCVTPMTALLTLRDEYPGITLLESKGEVEQGIRYSMIGLNPIAEFSAKKNKITIRNKVDDKVLQGDPLDYLRTLIRDYQCAVTHPSLGFTGGCVGFMTYDAVRLFEAIPDRHPDTTDLPDLFFRFYESSICFDHRANKIILSTLVETSDDLKKLYHESMNRLAFLQEKISRPHKIDTMTMTSSIDDQVSDEKSETVVDIEDIDFEQLVLKAKSYLANGDVFQVGLSRRFTQPFKGDPLHVYRALRFINPAPYMFYIDKGDTIFMGCSPEKLLSIQDGLIETVPIAGTKPRLNENDETDAINALMDSEKEEAEHMMLVDLARNDVGNVSEPGSVTVKGLKTVLKLKYVVHLISIVQGRLKKGLDAFDALRAVFPAGTLSGAPKIRAMEIIDELETSKRGIYGGAICYLDAKGNFDSCIAIRTAMLKDCYITVRAGGGIVADSDPTEEAMENRHKARALLKAIQVVKDQSQRGELQ
jgi:anthranilate synthase component 1